MFGNECGGTLYVIPRNAQQYNRHNCNGESYGVRYVKRRAEPKDLAQRAIVIALIGRRDERFGESIGADLGDRRWADYSADGMEMTFGDVILEQESQNQ
jgi:hypothetical protein